MSRDKINLFELQELREKDFWFKKTHNIAYNNEPLDYYTKFKHGIKFPPSVHYYGINAVNDDVGFIFLVWDDHFGEFQFEIGIYDEYQKKRYAKNTLQYLIDDAQKENVYKLHNKKICAVIKENNPLRDSISKMLLKLGFKEIKFGKEYSRYF